MCIRDRLSVKQIIFSCTSNSLAVIVNFRISQGSVATQLRWGGNCYDSYSDSFLGNLSVEEFWKSVNIRKSYDQNKVAVFSGTLCILPVRIHCGRYNYNDSLFSFHDLLSAPVFYHNVCTCIVIIIIVDTRCSEAWPLITDDGGHVTLGWSEIICGYNTPDTVVKHERRK